MDSPNEVPHFAVIEGRIPPSVMPTVQLPLFDSALAVEKSTRPSRGKLLSELLLFSYVTEEYKGFFSSER